MQPTLGVDDEEGHPLEDCKYITRAYETYMDDHLKLYETMSFKNMIYKDYMQQSLSRAMKLKFFEYSQSESVEGRALGCL